jgi:DNA-binding NarL/FixJ family response regulator
VRGRPGRNGGSNKRVPCLHGYSLARDCGWPQLRIGRRICEHAHVRPTVLIVDDHSAWRASARALLEADGFEVVGEAADDRQALRQARVLRPDVVLLDIQLPEADGFVVADRLAAQGSDAEVVLISSHEAATYGPRLAAARVRGFIPKRQLSGETLAALLP